MLHYLSALYCDFQVVHPLKSLAILVDLDLHVDKVLLSFVLSDFKLPNDRFVVADNYKLVLEEMSMCLG